MARILIVDDDKVFCKQLSLCIEKNDTYSYEVTDRLGKAVKIARSADFDIIFLDVMLPDGNGLQVIPTFREMPSVPEIIIVTSQGDSNVAELAVKNGAWYFLEKPTSFQTIGLLLDRALDYREKKRQFSEQKMLKRECIVGDSPKIRACLDKVARAAGSDGNVLITGETGTGKELFANAVHINSDRSKKSMVAIDCTSIPDTLGESLLFGHKKGTFTNADRDTVGLLIQANGSTLFFDEIGDMTLHVQRTLLRALQTKRFRPLGAKKEIHSDFRIISATNRDLDKMMEKALFREELYYRLVTFRIHLPPLRTRKQDIKPLALYYINQLCEKKGKDTKGVSKEFLESLTNYEWPGNVRELISVLHASIGNAMAEKILYPHHLPSKIKISYFKSGLQHDPQPASNLLHPDDLKKFPTFKEYRNRIVHQAEAQYLEALIRTAGGIKNAACNISGISQARLYQLLKKHDMRLNPPESA